MCCREATYAGTKQDIVDLMNLLRALAGAVLLTLMLIPGGVLAASVIELTPGGGNAALAPPSDGDDGRDRGDAAGTGPADTAPRSRQEADESDGGGDSDRFEPPQPDLQPGLQTRHFGVLANLSCEVAARSTDLVVVNRGTEPLAPGTRIKWQLKQSGTRGYFAIIGELGAGKALIADNVLDGKAGQDDICIARVI